MHLLQSLVNLALILVLAISITRKAECKTCLRMPLECNNNPEVHVNYNGNKMTGDVIEMGEAMNSTEVVSVKSHVANNFCERHKLWSVDNLHSPFVHMMVGGGKEETEHDEESVNIFEVSMKGMFAKGGSHIMVPTKEFLIEMYTGIRKMLDIFSSMVFKSSKRIPVCHTERDCEYGHELKCEEYGLAVVSGGERVKRGEVWSPAKGKGLQVTMFQGKFSYQISVATLSNHMGYICFKNRRKVPVHLAAIDPGPYKEMSFEDLGADPFLKHLFDEGEVYGSLTSNIDIDTRVYVKIEDIWRRLREAITESGFEMITREVYNKNKKAECKHNGTVPTSSEGPLTGDMSEAAHVGNDRVFITRESHKLKMLKGGVRAVKSCERKKKRKRRSVRLGFCNIICFGGDGDEELKESVENLQDRVDTISKNFRKEIIQIESQVQTLFKNEQVLKQEILELQGLIHDNSLAITRNAIETTRSFNALAERVQWNTYNTLVLQHNQNVVAEAAEKYTNKKIELENLHGRLMGPDGCIETEELNLVTINWELHNFNLYNVTTFVPETIPPDVEIKSDGDDWFDFDLGGWFGFGSTILLVIVIVVALCIVCR